jgi:flavorubredoxin
MTAIRPLETLVSTPFAAPEPAYHHAPLRIAEDTYVIQQLYGEGVAPISVYLNSMVILGEEPVIVDTGTVANSRLWFEDVQSLVDPEDVRWIYISHDDHDHTGNLARAMHLFKNATLVSTWFQLERLGGDYELPLDRMRWINDGDSFNVGDRQLMAIRPPVFDSPTTRGLFDPKTGCYWASDSFATAVTKPTEDVRDMDAEEWRQSVLTFGMAISPWISFTDPSKYAAHVDRLKQLDLKVIAGAHTPPIYGSYTRTAIDMMYELPSAPAFQNPTQADLEAIIAAASHG